MRIRTQTRYLGGKAGRLHAEGIIHGTPEVTWDTLYLSNEWPKFMPRNLATHYISAGGVEALRGTSARNLERLIATARQHKVDAARAIGGVWHGFMFIVMDLPFPIANRWYVIRVRHDETKSQQHQYERTWDLVFGNIDALEGGWQLEPGPQPCQTIARYQDTVDLGLKVPDLLTRMVAKLALQNTYRVLDEQVRKRALKV